MPDLTPLLASGLALLFGFATLATLARGCRVRWRIAGGTHRVAVGRSASDFVLTADTLLKARQFGL